MTRIIILSLLLIYPAFASAITRPHTAPDTLSIQGLDLKAIETAITDTESPYYYPVLMERYLDKDTFLTTEDYRHLYFGYSLQEDYNPYRTSIHEQALDSLYNRRNLSDAQRATLRKYALLVLEDNPFDLRRMSVLIHVATLNENKEEADFWQSRIHNLLDAILSTGDGHSPETAWHIIEPEHAYDLLNTLGVTPEAYEFKAPCYDYITVSDLIGNDRAFYFNISRILEEFHRKYNSHN